MSSAGRLSPSQDPDLQRDYELMRTDAAARVLRRDLIHVSGRDAVSWLQGQLSQDVGSMEVGDSAESLLLSPEGRLEAYLRVTLVSAEHAQLDMEHGRGEAALARLRRFRLRVLADVELEESAMLAVRGPGSAAAAAGATSPAATSPAATSPAATAGLALLPSSWPGWPGVDVIAPGVSPPPGLAGCAEAAWEAARIEAGAPRWGSELSDRTIPAEVKSLLDRAVSLEKGCYTGQELVARLDARGNRVPRRLRGLIVSSGTVPPRSATLTGAGRSSCGEVTSAAWSPAMCCPVALAYVRREVEPPARLGLEWDGGTAEATVLELPLAG